MTDPHAHYADWDAAYVLGALSPAERREFESHLESCDRCRTAVAELSGIPGLLGRLDAPRAFELLDAPAESDADSAVTIPPPPVELVARIERREASRRARRIRLMVGVAAAAVVAGALAIPVAMTTAPRPNVSTALSQVVESPLTADVKLTTVGWGTKLEMSCHYRAAAGGEPSSARWEYALWVIQDDGTANQLSSWSASSGSTVNLTAGTAVSVDDIAQVQVRSVEDGRVLLSSTLR